MKNTLKKLRTGALVTLAGAGLALAPAAFAEEVVQPVTETTASTPSELEVAEAEQVAAEEALKTAETDAAMASAELNAANSALKEAEAALTALTQETEATLTALTQETAKVIEQVRKDLERATAEVETLPDFQQSLDRLVSSDKKAQAAEEELREAQFALDNAKIALAEQQRANEEVLSAAKAALATKQTTLDIAEKTLSDKASENADWKATYDAYRQGNVEIEPINYSEHEDANYDVQPNKMAFTPSVGTPMTVDLGSNPADVEPTTAALTDEAIKIITAIRQANGLTTNLTTDKAIQAYAEFRLQELAKFDNSLSGGTAETTHATSTTKVAAGWERVGENIAGVHEPDIFQKKSLKATVVPSMLGWMTDYFNITGRNYGHARTILINNSSDTVPVKVAYANNGKHAVLVYASPENHDSEKTYRSQILPRIAETENPDTGELVHTLDGKQVVLPAPYIFTMKNVALTNEDIETLDPDLFANYVTFVQAYEQAKEAVAKATEELKTLESAQPDQELVTKKETAQVAFDNANDKLKRARADLEKALEADEELRQKIQTAYKEEWLLKNKLIELLEKQETLVPARPAVEAAKQRVEVAKGILDIAQTRVIIAKDGLEEAQAKVARLKAQQTVPQPTTPNPQSKPADQLPSNQESRPGVGSPEKPSVTEGLTPGNDSLGTPPVPEQPKTSTGQSDGSQLVLKGEPETVEDLPTVHLISETQEGTTAKIDAETADEKPVGIYRPAPTQSGLMDEQKDQNDVSGGGAPVANKPVTRPMEGITEIGTGQPVEGLKTDNTTEEVIQTSAKALGSAPLVVKSQAVVPQQSAQVNNGGSAQLTSPSGQQAKALPNTGSARSVASLVGMGLLVSVFGLMKRRRRFK